MDPLLKYESAQTLVAAVALSDSGDHTIFNSAHNFFSGVSGKTPVIMPNGVLSGGLVTPAASETNNYVDVSQVVLNLNGVETTVSADTDVECTRATPTDTHIINSITINSSGAVAVVAGTDGTSFSETRGAAGGPPLIPVDSVEIAQVRFSSNSDAAVDSDEIYMVPGTHREMALHPMYTVRKFTVEDGVLGYAGVTFDAALPLIHTGSVPKAVYAQYYTPTFASISRSAEFVRPANSKSVSSEEFYGGAKGKVSTSLGAGSFKVHAASLAEGVLAQEGDNILFEFFPDRLDTDLYVVCQGYLGVQETFETDGGITAACTINAEAAGHRVIA